MDQIEGKFYFSHQTNIFIVAAYFLVMDDSPWGKMECEWFIVIHTIPGKAGLT